MTRSRSVVRPTRRFPIPTPRDETPRPPRYPWFLPGEVLRFVPCPPRRVKPFPPTEWFCAPLRVEASRRRAARFCSPPASRSRTGVTANDRDLRLVGAGDATVQVHVHKRGGRVSRCTVRLRHLRLVGAVDGVVAVGIALALADDNHLATRRAVRQSGAQVDRGRIEVGRVLAGGRWARRQPRHAMGQADMAAANRRPSSPRIDPPAPQPTEEDVKTARMPPSRPRC